jgi:predicted methyltransferase
MNTNRPLLALVLALSAAGAAVSAPAKAPPADVTSAVAASGRPADAIKLDADRKPAAVLAFMGLRRGDRALDLFTGTGYFAEIMGRAVGPTGSVIAWQPANFVNDKARTAFAELHARVPNVGVMTTPAGALSLPTATFDFAMIDLNYHDTYWQNEHFHFRMDPVAFLHTVYDSMKPGGVVAVIDHVANPGGDTRAVVDKLHRIDPATVKADFEHAGFVLEAQSDLLRNPADDHSKLVFDPAIRGKTDRFVWRFRKPRH